MTKFKIDIKKIDREIFAIDKSFNKMHMGESISGVSYTTVKSWYINEAPPIVELIHYNSKALNHSFLEMINLNYEKFPVLKLLMYYHQRTNKSIENVIIIDRELIDEEIEHNVLVSKLGFKKVNRTLNTYRFRGISLTLRSENDKGSVFYESKLLLDRCPISYRELQDIVKQIKDETNE